MSKIIRSNNPLLPEVKITNPVLKEFGDISVDLDGLNEILRDDLGLTKPVTPKFVFYGRVAAPPILGFHYPYTKSVYVQMPASDMIDKTHSTIVHEAVHLVDSIESPLRTAGELALRGLAHFGAVRAGRYVNEVMPGPEATDLIAQGVTYYQLRMGLFYRHLDPSENRARLQEKNDLLVEKCREVVLFKPRHVRRIERFLKELE